jgi:rubrerythrin
MLTKWRVAMNTNKAAIICYQQTIEELEGVKGHIERRIQALRDRIEELQAPEGHGPYWQCPACKRPCYGWRGDEHKCPTCGAWKLKEIDKATYDNLVAGRKEVHP